MSKQQCYPEEFRGSLIFTDSSDCYHDSQERTNADQKDRPH